MLGSGGCVPGTGEFLAALREESERAGSLLILDEVMTSRLGGHGAQSLHGIAPDLTTLGKWIGGGMSFGAFGGRGDAMDIYDPRRSDAVPHAGTFQNNVLTMAAGITALGEIYTPEHAVAHDARGEALRDRLNGIADEIGVPVRSTGMGSLMNLHPTTRPITDHAGVVGADDRLRELIFLDLLDAGYYVARRGFIALQLPVTDDDLDGFANAYRTVLENRANILQAYG
jgi:glutamate-1-semialdehyde 2,1-aminomutase